MHENVEWYQNFDSFLEIIVDCRLYPMLVKTFALEFFVTSKCLTLISWQSPDQYIWFASCYRTVCSGQEGTEFALTLGSPMWKPCCASIQTNIPSLLHPVNTFQRFRAVTWDGLPWISCGVLTLSQKLFSIFNMAAKGLDLLLLSLMFTSAQTKNVKNNK